MTKGKKYVCSGRRGFISVSSYKRMSGRQRRQCRIVISKGRPKTRYRTRRKR